MSVKTPLTQNTTLVAFPDQNTKEITDSTVIDLKEGEINYRGVSGTDNIAILSKPAKSLLFYTNSKVVLSVIGDKNAVVFRATIYPQWIRFPILPEFWKISIDPDTSTNIQVYASSDLNGVPEVSRSTSTYIRSDKDRHFTGAIAQNAAEEENITGLEANKIKITRITLMADESLSFRVWLFGADGFTNSDMDSDRYITWKNFDLTTNGKQYTNTGFYRFDKTNLNIDYEDFDGTNELHVALECLSAAGKTAGAAGEVVIEIGYEVRE